MIFKINAYIFFVVVIVSCQDLEPQPSVITPGKNHALYLWIHLKNLANFKQVASVVTALPLHVRNVVPANESNADNELLAGVGFGEAFYAKIGKTNQIFPYYTRYSMFGTMPATGGDIFIHGKSNSFSKVFELAQRILSLIPSENIDSFEDTYGFVYKNGRDLSGFIDGTENPQTEDLRKTVAVNSRTGGSFVITQRWIHKMNYIAEEKVKILEGLIGRTMNTSVELMNKPPTSHVSRVLGTAAFKASKPFQIVRQSQPYGRLCSEAGLFFIAYANSTNNFNFILNNMVGAGTSGTFSDGIMRVSNPVSGNYWYFPGVDELKQISNSLNS